MNCSAAVFFWVKMVRSSALASRALMVSNGRSSCGVVRLDMRLPLYAGKQNNTEKDALPEFIKILRAWILVQGSVLKSKEGKGCLGKVQGDR